MSLGWGSQQEGAMVRLLSYTTRIGIDSEGGPKEIVKTPSPSGDSGWLIRFFDSAFFCEWIAVSYLFKHEHAGVRDYLCNRMYTLPLTGIENYLFQLCYMLVHMPSPSLERYIIDMCAKSLRIAIKVHWFLMAEAEDVDDSTDIVKLQEKCQIAAMNGDWPPLIRPQKNATSPGAKSRVFKALLSSRRLLPMTSSPPTQRPPPPIPSPTAADEGFREAGRPLQEETDLSLKGLKKFIPTTKVRNAFLKTFREKEEKEEKEDEEVIITERPVKEIESDSFFKRLFKDKDEDEKGVRSEELVNSEGFFRRLFRDKSDADEKIDEEKEGFFRKLFRDKPDEEEKGMEEEDENSEFFLFRKFFRQVHPEDDKLAEAFTGQEHPALVTPENSPVNENFFKRLFKDRTLEDGAKFFGMRRDGDVPVTPSTTPSGFLRRFFKDRNDEEGAALADELGSLSISHDSTEGSNEGNFLQESLRGMTLFRGKIRTHDADILAKDFSFSRPTETSSAEPRGPDVVDIGCKGLDDADDADASDVARLESATLADRVPTNSCSWKLPSSDSSIFDLGRSFIRRPGSPKQRTEKASAKPPLPKYSSFHIRKGVYHATLDFVQSLCDTSSGLVDIFPMEDRRQALRESLVELNHHLVVAENDGGVCFPMGKGMYRVVHIPEEELVLLNSREKAPYMICVELLKCEAKSGHSKDQKEAGAGTKLAKGGIPLANGDAQLQRPPPWAYPLQPDVQQPNTQQLLRTASKAIDLAMAHLWETKLKVVDVSFSVQPTVHHKLNCQVEGVKLGEEARPGKEESRCYSSGVSNLMETEQTSPGLDTACRCILSEGEAGNCRNPSTCIINNNDLRKDQLAVKAGRGGTDELHSHPQDSCEGDKLEMLKDRGCLQVHGCDGEEWVSVTLSVVPGVNMEDVEEEQPERKREHRRVPSTVAMAAVTAAVAEGEAPAGLPLKKSGTAPSVTQTEERIGINVKPTDALAGELWENKRERIQRSSKWSSNTNWDLRSLIVKSGDDCRQEHLAVQLVAHFYDIFQEAGLPLWLRPYEVLVTSSHTALIETIYDTASIHAIKSRNIDLASLRDFFCKKYKEGSPSFKLAQSQLSREPGRLILNLLTVLSGFFCSHKKRQPSQRLADSGLYVSPQHFAEKLRGEHGRVKDRHNSNLLLDEDGHIIHIDFGFMLSNSPGGVNFESAPFKLTRELLEGTGHWGCQVMDSDAEGKMSEFFDYFKVLCIQGFLTCRKHAERIILLVEMMQDSGCPCFKGGPRTMQNLRKRFHLSLTEEQCVSLVLSLISSSLDAWRTRQYDYYQRVLNGIL